jgi:hypothetical protein
MNKNADEVTSLAQNKGTQFGTEMLWYRTEIPDAGMPMPSHKYISLFMSSLFEIISAIAHSQNIRDPFLLFRCYQQYFFSPHIFRQ